MFLIIFTLTEIRKTETKVIRSKFKDLEENTIISNLDKKTMNKLERKKQQTSTKSKKVIKKAKHIDSLLQKNVEIKPNIDRDTVKQKQQQKNKTNQRKKKKQQQKKKTKQKKTKKQRQKRKRKKGRLMRKKQRKNISQKKSQKSKANNNARSNTQKPNAVNNFLEHVLNVEKKTRKKSTKDENESSQDNNTNITNVYNTTKRTLKPVTIKTISFDNKQKVQGSRNQRQQEKKKKQKTKPTIRVKTNKCASVKRKLKAKTIATCTRAKARAKMSYQTMDLLFEQSFSESQIIESLHKKQVKYSNFWNATSDFVSKNEKCDTNPNWNSVFLKEKLTNFKELTSDLNSYFLGGRSSAPDEEDPKSLAISANQRRGLQKCMESQKLHVKCTHCNKKCGSAMKNGEIVEYTAVVCFYMM